MFLKQIKMAFTGLLLLGASVTQATSMFATPTPAGPLNIGDSFSVDIVIDSISDLAGFEFDLNFDFTLVTATTIISGDIFGFDTVEISNSLAPGVATFSEATLAFSGVNITAPTVIATISFDTLAAGVSSLNIVNALLSDSLGDPIPDPTVINSSIQVDQPSNGNVPLPGVWLLMLAGLAAFRWQNKLIT